MMKKCLELSNMDSLIVGNTYLEVRMRKHNGKKIIGAILLLVILVLVGNGKMQQAKADPLQPEIARKILRFHILANSDSEEDQQKSGGNKKDRFGEYERYCSTC